MFNFISAALAVALLLCASPATARQRVLTVDGSPFMTFELPRGWKVSEIERGLQIRSNDGEAYVWIESYAPSQRDAVLAEHDKYFAGQGVRIKGDPEVQPPQQADGKTIVYMEFQATWKSAPTVLRYALVDPHARSGREVIVSYWVSPDASQRVDEDVLTMTESLALAR